MNGNESGLKLNTVNLTPNNEKLIKKYQEWYKKENDRNISKSEVIRLAIEHFLVEFKQKK